MVTFVVQLVIYSLEKRNECNQSVITLIKIVTVYKLSVTNV